MKKFFLIVTMLFFFGVICSCSSSWWSTMYGRGKTYKVIELDNSKRYIYVHDDENEGRFASCLEHVGPSAKDELYKLALTNPAGVKIQSGSETKSSTIYNVGEIMQFGQSSLFRICENYMNGVYGTLGKEESKKEYIKEFNKIMRKTALLVALHSGENADKAKFIVVLNAIEENYESFNDSNEMKKILEELKKSLVDKNQTFEIEKLDRIQKTLDELKSKNILNDQKSTDIKTILQILNWDKKQGPEDKTKPDTISQKPEAPNTTQPSIVEFKLDSLFFDTNKSVLRPEALKSLRSILTFYKSNYFYKLDIIGHADSIGKLQNNKKLSCDRAKSIRTEILKELPKSSVKVYGCGAFEPIISYNLEKPKEIKEISRRTEFIFYTESHDLIKNERCECD